ncbi:MAG TPA: polysaccharide deacetylase family protein [Vicinamibacterales bacterium]
MSTWKRLSWPDRAKYAVKSGVAWFLHVTGLLRFLMRRRLRGRTVVLLYHRVLSPDQVENCWSHRAIVVERDTFARHMAALRREFEVLSLEQFTERLASPSASTRPACLVTFDDGWWDTYAQAWPVLREHGIPAVVFLPTQFIGSTQRFWQERLGAVLYELWRRSRSDAALVTRARPVLERLELASLLDAPAASAREVVRDLVQRRKLLDPRGAAAAIDELVALLGTETDGPLDGFMTWPQVREMAEAGIAFGAHTISHRILTTLPPDEVEQEVRGSRETLLRELGTAPAFSYPNGNWNRDVAAAVGNAPFALAFTTQPGAVSATADRLALPRINIHEDVTRSVPLFFARLSGVL